MKINEDTVTLYEELTMNAHPAIKTYFYDGWVLRFANGYTGRANSVGSLYPSRIGFAEKIAHCEKLYAEQGLPSVFKLTKYSPPGLDEALEELGYESGKPTYVLINPSISKLTAGSKTVITPSITEHWQENFFCLSKHTDVSTKQTAIMVQNNIQNKALTGTITENGNVIACGLCVVEREYAGLYDIHVDENYRRMGHGYDLCSSLLHAAANSGARTGYLQMVASNAAAKKLYEKIGFEFGYEYWYRTKESK